jgi:hypothetical protein
VGPEKSDSLHRRQRQEKNRQNRLGLVVSLLWRSNGHAKLMGFVTPPDFSPKRNAITTPRRRELPKKRKKMHELALQPS